MQKLMLCLIAIVFLAGCGGGNWDVKPPPVSGTDPAIRITSVTWTKGPLGNIVSIHAQGQTYNVVPSGYKVSIWIRVGGIKWPKPTFDNPFTGIAAAGYWKSGDLTTGGNDQDADAVTVYLVKKNTTWKPGQNEAPAGDIVAEDTVYKPTTSGVDARGTRNEIVSESSSNSAETP